ncbi:hypothetical protein VB780_20700 [Leptolyngbya sp. CCNP1308]|nr:hypothetical protein [Leptolyngbya sp. CCNP1308]MEA5451010.1 hypothetical protein [Leptolyngbya sp. CCNP1308]
MTSSPVLNCVYGATAKDLLDGRSRSRRLTFLLTVNHGAHPHQGNALGK